MVQNRAISRYALFVVLKLYTCRFRDTTNRAFLNPAPPPPSFIQSTTLPQSVMLHTEKGMKPSARSNGILLLAVFAGVVGADVFALNLAAYRLRQFGNEFYDSRIFVRCCSHLYKFLNILYKLVAR